MEVDVEDVQMELEQRVSTITDGADRDFEVPRPQGFDPEYIKDLFTSSIQAAVALVRDAEDCTTRATRRITILLHLMEGGIIALDFLLVCLFVLVMVSYLFPFFCFLIFMKCHTFL